MTKHRLHVVALPHTITTKEYCACAYTMKVLNFCKMMKRLGYTVFHYGTDGSEVDCDEHVTVITQAQQRELIGQTDWKQKMFQIEWNSSKPYWQVSNHNAAREIAKRKKRKDFLCLIGGCCQQPIAEAVGAEVLPVEYGVGYHGIFAKNCVFESYAHQAVVYGEQKITDGRFYDAVIPNYYDLQDFALDTEKDDYLLYIGRLIRRKGVQLAIDIAAATGKKILIAGQGATAWGEDFILGEEGVKFSGPTLSYVGYADVMKRMKLMSRARAVMVPTQYLEPFGGVAVEAQLCGTPVITTDWGAFPETVQHGTTGFRCRTKEQFIWAVNHVNELDPYEISRWARKNYSLERVSLMYQEYFDMLYTLWDKGWGQERPRTELDWLKKSY
jgi:glycosyltransferase involved in cell wall biosynthesis